MLHLVYCRMPTRAIREWDRPGLHPGYGATKWLYVTRSTAHAGYVRTQGFRYCRDYSLSHSWVRVGERGGVEGSPDAIRGKTT